MRATVLLLAVACVLVACDQSTSPDAVAPMTSASTQGERKVKQAELGDETCASYPPPFEAGYLPRGFSDRLRKGAGLFKGTDYPTEGLLGHYLGPRDTIHINFETDPGPLPYEPANPKPIRVQLGRTTIGKIEGGFAVRFSFVGCPYRMDTYGISRRETTNVVKGLSDIGGPSYECATGIEGNGFKPGEPIPPRPYFVPFNRWQSPVRGGCLSVLAGRKLRWDDEAGTEKGSRARGAIWIFDFGRAFIVKGRDFLFSDLGSPIRVVDYSGRGLDARLIVQSLKDCGLATFVVRTRQFESASGNYPCPPSDKAPN